MKLICPSCSTGYVFNSRDLGPNGRRVRCARCSHVWFQPPESLPDSEILETLAPRPERQFVSEDAKLPALPDRYKFADRLGWAILVLLIVGSLSGSYLFRNSIMQSWPETRTLYRLIGLAATEPAEQVPDPGPVKQTLMVRDLNYSFVEAGGDRAGVLVLQGNIVNTGSLPRSVPNLRVGLLDERGAEIQDWVFTPPITELAAGALAPFTTQLESPSPAVRSAAVTFIAE